MPQLVEIDAERRDEAQDADREQLHGRPWAGEESDRHGGERRHERDQPEADVGERAQQLRRLLVVQPQAVVGVHQLPSLARERVAASPGMKKYAPPRTETNRGTSVTRSRRELDWTVNVPPCGLEGATSGSASS